MLSGDADPSSGRGVPATMPALYFRVAGGAGSLYLKTGDADTDWDLVAGRAVAAAIEAAIKPVAIDSMPGREPASGPRARNPSRNPSRKSSRKGERRAKARAAEEARA